MKPYRNQKGFTLIELLIVVAIIGVLAAVGIPMYNGYIANAKINTVKNTHKQVVKLFNTSLATCAGGAKLSLNKYNCEKWTDLCSKDDNNNPMTGHEFGGGQYIGRHFQCAGTKNPYIKSEWGVDGGGCSDNSCSNKNINTGMTIYSAMKRSGNNSYILILSKLSDTETVTTTIPLNCAYGSLIGDCY